MVCERRPNVCYMCLAGLTSFAVDNKLKKMSEHAVDKCIELAKVRMQRVMICKCISLTCHIQVALMDKANRTLISMIVSFYISIRGVGSYNNTYNSL